MTESFHHVLNLYAPKHETHPFFTQLAKRDIILSNALPLPPISLLRPHPLSAVDAALVFYKFTH